MAGARRLGTFPGTTTRGLTALALTALGLLAPVSGCDAGRGRSTAGPDLDSARVALGASFVGGRATGLRELLHADLVVQPPEPDTALAGEPAASYLERLARESSVSRSELLPASVSPEGGFLLERGGWQLESAGRTFTSRYMIRWREMQGGWRLVLLRWTVFR